MAAIVYILCAVTSGLCAVLLLRHAANSPSRLLFWSGLSFVCLTIANALLFFDLILFPDKDLLVLRHLITLAAICTLLYGLIWETE
jgi:hypothetical protein